jgi:hypothetical protein
MKVSLYGDGQISNNVAAILRGRSDIEVLGPYGRADRDRAIGSGADVVVIGTTTFLRDVAPDIREAVSAGSNVITSAEEAAFPAVIDREIADELDQLARKVGVSVLGAGINPGYVFDALVLTATGVVSDVESLRVERVVDVGQMSETVLRRMGLARSPKSFAEGSALGEVTGHVGFPQSMHIVATQLGVTLERIDHQIDPLIADEPHAGRYLLVTEGLAAGVAQTYTGIVDGRPWFEAVFTGHIDPLAIGKPPRDDIYISGSMPVHLTVSPGIDALPGASAIIANSARRVANAAPGWLTVGDLPPAVPV